MNELRQIHQRPGNTTGYGKYLYTMYYQVHTVTFSFYARSIVNGLVKACIHSLEWYTSTDGVSPVDGRQKVSTLLSYEEAGLGRHHLAPAAPGEAGIPPAGGVFPLQ